MSVAGVWRALSPRGALALRAVDGALLFAVRAALAMGLIAVPLTATGRPDLAVYAMLGSFTTTFGRNMPYGRRARVLAVAALAMTACVGGGSALAAWAGPDRSAPGVAVVVAATALVAGGAKLACDAARLTGLGAVLLLFSFAVSANAPSPWSEVPYRTALAASGAALAWLLALSGRLVHPERPQRLAVASALRRLAELLEAAEAGPVPARVRHGATVAVLRAYACLEERPPDAPGTPRPARGQAVFTCLTDLSWTLLVGTAGGIPAASGTARSLRCQAALLTARHRRTPDVLPELRRVPAAPAVAPRATELLTGRRRRVRADRLAVLAVPALRMALGTAVAGGIAAALNLEHGYWASISAAAVLHSVNLRTTAQRAVQRVLGTSAGLLIALGVLAADLRPVVLALVIVALEFLLEYVVPRNYGLGVVFLTPMALLMSDLAAPSPAGQLVVDRVLGSVVGIGTGLLCALLVVHDRAAVRVDRALSACRAAVSEAERTLSGATGAPSSLVQARLATAAVELRDADDAAAGELWPAGIDPTELAATEQRAYELLARLHHRT